MATTEDSTNWSASSASPGVGRKAVVAVGLDTFDFNLQLCMAKVLKNLEEKVPSTFKKYYASTQYARLVRTFILYFTSIFVYEWILKAMEKTRKQHVEGYNPYVAVARMRELEEEKKSLQAEISQSYSGLILKYACFEKPQQDRMFFETLYETLISIVDDAFSKLSRRPDIEQEIGILFRSRHFNMYKRKNLPPRSVDTLSVKELYAIKNESSNRILNARMLSSLFEKPPSTGITSASVTNSPLISSYISSPAVSRALMKDPETRQNMMKPKADLSLRPTTRSIGAVFRSAALLQGADPSKLAGELDNMQMSESTKESIGMMGADKAYRTDLRQRSHLAPETAGLPVDDTINYLTLMKRYVLHGPGLGLKEGQHPHSHATAAE